jgi:hypothetical protein
MGRGRVEPFLCMWACSFPHIAGSSLSQLVGQVFGQDEAEGAQWLFGSDYVADVFHDVTEQDLNFAKAILMRMSVIIMTDTLQYVSFLWVVDRSCHHYAHHCHSLQA